MREPRELEMHQCRTCSTLLHSSRVLYKGGISFACGACGSDDMVSVKLTEQTEIDPQATTKDIICLSCSTMNTQPVSMSICGQCYSSNIFVINREKAKDHVRRMMRRGAIAFVVIWDHRHYLLIRAELLALRIRRDSMDKRITPSVRGMK